MTDPGENVSYYNHDGYMDRTAHDAMQHVLDEQYKVEIEADGRNYRLIKTVKNMIDLAGFDLVGRITVIDRKTGRRYE